MRYTLSDREFTFFSQMVYRINSLTGYEEVAATVLKQLQYIIPFTKGIIFQICETEPGMGLVYQAPVALDPPGQAFDEDRFMKGSYRSDWLSYTSSPWSNTFRQSDIRDEATFRDTPLYRDIYRPQDIYYGLHSILVHKDHKLAQLGLFRPEESKDFSERDVFILSALSLHLELKLYAVLENSPCVKCRSQGSRLLEENEFHYDMMRRFGLTKREIEVGVLLCRGMSSQEITVSLFISKSTLDKHIYNIYRKTGVKNRTQLVRLVRSGEQPLQRRPPGRGRIHRPPPPGREPMTCKVASTGVSSRKDPPAGDLFLHWNGQHRGRYPSLSGGIKKCNTQTCTI